MMNYLHVLGFFLRKTNYKKKFQIFDQNNGLIPLEKCKFLDYAKMTFFAYKVLLWLFCS